MPRDSASPPRPHAPRTVLGFDFGTQRIGVAVGQEQTHTASALVTLAAREGQPDWSRVEALIKQWRPAAFVVGLPLMMDGSEQEITPRARRFGNRLHGRFGLPVFFVDERLTSKEAGMRIRERGERIEQGSLDREAARIIIEIWLEQQAHPDTRAETRSEKAAQFSGESDS